MATATVDRPPVTIQTAETAAVELVQQTIAELTPYEAQAESIVIHTDADYESVAATLLDTRGRMKALEAKRVDLVAPLNGVVQKINQMFRRPMELLDGVSSILNRKLGDYRAAQEEARRQAEQAAREAAAKEAERIRKEAEAAAKRMEKKGDAEGAEAVRASAEAVAVAMPVVLPPVTSAPKVAGMATRHNWKARVTDASKVPEAFWVKTLNQAALDAMAKQTKRAGPAPGIPGVEFYDGQRSYGTGR